MQHGSRKKAAVTVPLDSYSLRARFFPAVLVLLPVIASVAAWMPLGSLSWKTVASLGCLAAFATLLSHLVRDVGKRRETSLFEAWNGAPSVRFLRHRDSTLPDATKDRYRSKLAVIPGINMPTSRSERARPDAADAIYQSCCEWLREATRDRNRFGLLFEENVAFGFRRNLWAMKPVGVVLSAAGFVAAGFHAALDIRDGRSPTIEAFVATALSTSLLIWWLVRISPSWVSAAANAYARQLLATCDNL